MVQLIPLILTLCGFTTFLPMETYYHPVSTEVCEAQDCFNHGMVALYGFDYDGAYESFEKASQLDPKLAIAYWGMALALEEEGNPEEAKKKIEKALSLKGSATENEQDYIEAFSTRYFKKEEENKHTNYRESMKKVALKYPDDPDASVLYAESLMNLLAWHPWKNDRTPQNEMTNELVEVLSGVLKKTSFHPGANHYYIHSIEGSKHPERGLEAARNLSAFKEWGHLLHSSSHIYLRTGEYQKAVEANLNAYAADKRYTEMNDLKSQYAIKYLPHTLYFLMCSYLWQEKEEESLQTAKTLQKFVAPYLKDHKQLESNMLAETEVYLYFHCWDQILQIEAPDDSLPLSRAYWHFARAMAFIGKGEMHHAEEEERAFLKKKEQLPEDKTLEMANAELKASLLKARGELKECCEVLRRLVEKEDELGFLGWPHQNRQTLGAALLMAGHPEEAECVFRESLDFLPHNGRSLFGLSQALKAQKKFDYWVEREAKEALKYSTKELNLSDL